MKKALMLLLALLLLVSLVGCGLAEDASSGSTGADISDENTPEATQYNETPSEMQVEETPAETPLEAVSPAAAEATPQLLSLTVNSQRQDAWDGDVHLCYAGFDSIFLDEKYDDSASENSDNFYELSAALEQMNEAHAQAAEEAMPVLQSAASEAYADTEDFYIFYIETDLMVTRADSRVLSLLRCSASYEGGAHENYLYNGVTFDSDSGNILTLPDVLSDTAALPELLAGLLTEKYADTRFVDLRDTFESYVAEDDFSWTLSYQGITFYFSPYELASFADGLLTVTIRFDDMPDLFKQEYTAVPLSYAVPLRLDTAWPSSFSEVYDLDGDGKADELYINAQLDEYDFYDCLSITHNGSTLSEDCYAYELCPYLVHTANGKSFLYVESLADNDYATVGIYDLNGEAPVLVGTVESTGFHNSWSGKNGVLTNLLTNPDLFKLDTRITLLGTMTGVRTYCVDDGNGMPLPTSTYYNIDGYITVINKVPLELNLPEEEGKTETFPAGTVFACFQTDNATYMDVKLEDGRICRVAVETNDGETTIGGMDMYDVFDGILFVG